MPEKDNASKLTKHFETQRLDVAPGPDSRSVRVDGGDVVAVPPGWSLLPPGDAGLTRRVKAAGPSWTVKEKKGRRTFSKGVWANSNVIAAETKRVESERSTEAYAKRQVAAKDRRDKKQGEYVEDFRAAILTFLKFHQQHQDLANAMADLVTAHATPVGSGTVARTQRIPIERRAESAVIAWLRHQTTAYDNMKIARVKGRRREVRRELAAQSRIILARYRQPTEIPLDCPLAKALRSHA
jgi:hypothetical protein